MEAMMAHSKELRPPREQSAQKPNLQEDKMKDTGWQKLREAVNPNLKAAKESLTIAIDAQDWWVAALRAEDVKDHEEVLLMLEQLRGTGDLPEALKLVARYVDAVEASQEEAPEEGE